MEKVLVVVDYQKDFVDGALGFPGAETIINFLEASLSIIFFTWVIDFASDIDVPPNLHTLIICYLSSF